MNKSKAVGDQGEYLAKNYLQQQGYLIIATNWHCRGGEIDIIAKQGDILVFIEVKTRQAKSIDDVFSAMTPTKQARLLTAIHTYLDTLANETEWRVDVIGIAISKSSEPIIEHVEDALAW